MLDVTSCVTRETRKFLDEFSTERLPSAAALYLFEVIETSIELRKAI